MSRLGIVIPMKQWGGIEGKIVTLCQEFCSFGIEVEIFLPRGGQVPYPERLPSDVAITDLRSNSKVDTARRLAKHLRTRRVDALLAGKDHGVKAALLGRWLAGTKTPVYIKLTNTLSLTLRRPIKRLTARLMYPHADGAIAVSEGVRQDFIDTFPIAPERVKTIYNPAIPRDFKERAAAPPPHPWLASGEIPVVIGVGRLTAQKGFEVLLSAFAELRSHHLARLIILGGGPLRESLENQAITLGVADDVYLAGPTTDALPWLSHSSLYALSSHWEGLPNVLIEGLAAGTAVVATDCPSGPREILENGRLGRLVPTNNPSALAGAMAESLGAKPENEKLQTSLRRFESRTVAQLYIHFLGLSIKETPRLRE